MPPSSRRFLRTNSPPFPLPSNSCLSYCLPHLLSVLIPSSSSLFPSLLIIPSVSPPFPSFTMPPPFLSSFLSSSLLPLLLTCHLYLYSCLSHISSKSFPSSPSLLLLSFPFHPSLSLSISPFPFPPCPRLYFYPSSCPPAPVFPSFMASIILPNNASLPSPVPLPPSLSSSRLSKTSFQTTQNRP